ncbi:MAG TPA: ubiquitin-like domain-containing protein [Anaerolineales bacterium]|nr:ubiquitin-like domain-containing protein [Anaerolineales bacterium]
MKLNCGLALAFIFLLVACQTSPPPPTVTIIDNDKIISLQTNERVPLAILAQVGITLNPDDRLLLNGLPSAPEQPISSSLVTNSPTTLQLRRAVPLTIITPDGERQIQSSAFTVGEALSEASIWLRAGEKVDPPLHFPISGQNVQFSNSPISISPFRQLSVQADGKTMKIVSSAKTVGEALAEAGIPLLGLDTSLPSANEALPSDGQIKVVRVSESILLTQKPIPFESELVASADVPLDQIQILQPGENGLNMQRIRIRYEDGQEISRTTENQTLVRPPKTRVLGYGTKIEVKTAVVDGVQIEYWRAVQMYATAYSPCRSGGDLCSSGTSSGKKLAKGMVGLRYSWYLAMGGQPLYIPGYGFATVEDVCGGCVGKPWIDLGYSDDDYQHWSSWVTVYFLTPVPANVIYVLE